MPVHQHNIELAVVVKHYWLYETEEAPQDKRLLFLKSAHCVSNAGTCTHD